MVKSRYVSIATIPLVDILRKKPPPASFVGVSEITTADKNIQTHENIIQVRKISSLRKYVSEEKINIGNEKYNKKTEKLELIISNQNPQCPWV